MRNPPSSEHMVAHAADLLVRVQSFFPRLEAKASVVLGIDTAMLGYLATWSPQSGHWSWLMLLAVIPILLIACSLLQLYRCSFPELAGGYESLQYFQEIAKRTESKFIADFSAQAGDDLARDLLGQVWRNSEILTCKYACLKRAYTFCALAVLPWAVSIGVLAYAG